jgi:hypothetical protein
VTVPGIGPIISSAVVAAIGTNVPATLLARERDDEDLSAVAHELAPGTFSKQTYNTRLPGSGRRCVSSRHAHAMECR